jgi:hypothetical protein
MTEIIDAEIVEEEEHHIPDHTLVAPQEERPLGQVSIYRSMDPDKQLEEARARAKVLVEVVREQGLAKTFGSSPKPHVFVEGWQFLASQFGLVPDIEWTRELLNASSKEVGWEARAALVRLEDGQTIAHAEGECRTTEANWKNRPSYAIRSMAQTRAVSKVCRIALSSVMVMAGFNATPAEEMDGVAVPKPDRKKQTRIITGATQAAPLTADDPHCPACALTHGTLVPVTNHDRKPYWRCTADPRDCGGFRVYEGKEYSWSGWRTDFDNSVAEYLGTVVKDDPKTANIGAPDDRLQRSDYIVAEIMATAGLTTTVDATMLVKPGLSFAITEGKVDAEAALGGPPSDPITEDELRTIAVNLTLAEADEVIAAAATLAAPFETKGTE